MYTLIGMRAMIICAILCLESVDSLSFRQIESEPEYNTEETQKTDLPRILIQTGAGTFTGSLCAALGWIGCGYIGYLMGHDPPILEAAIGAYTGFTLGSPLGIWGVGKADGVESSFKETLYGSLEGSAIGATILIAANLLSIDPLRSRWELPIAGSLIGGFLAFYKRIK